MTEREAEAVETDYHATVNLIVLLSYWCREHPFSEVRAQVWKLRDQLGQQLAHNIYELTGIADWELCEEEAEEAWEQYKTFGELMEGVEVTEEDMERTWQDFLRILKEHREAKQGDARDEPEAEDDPEEETARGSLAADASREEVIKASRGKPEPEADEEVRNLFRGPAARDLAKAAAEIGKAAFDLKPPESRAQDEWEELKAREEADQKMRERLDSVRATIEETLFEGKAVGNRLDELLREAEANPPRWSERIAALEEWREVTDERVTMLEKDEEMRSDAVNFLETEVEDLKDRAKECETRIATLEMSRDDHVDDVNRRLITMEKAMARAETRRDATLAAIGETLAMKCRESLGDKEAAEGLPLRTGWKPGAPPSQPEHGKVFVVRVMEGEVGVTDGVREKPEESTRLHLHVCGVKGWQLYFLPNSVESHMEVPCPA